MRILVIEDSAPTRVLLEHALASSGHSVSTAARVSTGRTLALEQPFDVLVIDVMLPDGNGVDLCRDLRAEGIATPILFLTARGEVDERIEGLDAGADDYLRKPFAVAELKARLRALGRRHGQAAPTVIQWPGVRIDFAARRLERGGEPVPLTAREWTVLETLAARRGRVVSRDDLLETAWGEVSSAASESLAVIMSRLRRKLHQEGLRDSIRTVRGEGFVFEAPR